MVKRNKQNPEINQSVRQQVFEALTANPLGHVKDIAAECGVTPYRLLKLAGTCPEITEAYGAGLVAKLNQAIDRFDQAALRGGNLSRGGQLIKLAYRSQEVSFYQNCVKNWQAKHGGLLPGIKAHDAKAIAKLKRT